MAMAYSEATEALSSREKFARIRVRALVEVKAISMIGREPVWIRARVLNTHKGGAQCRTEKGKEGFYPWGDIRECHAPDPHKPIATLGEIAHGGIRSLPPFLDTTPPEPPPQDLKMAASKPKPKRQRQIQILTRISHIFREERLKRAWSQDELAEHLNTSGGQISKYENGRSTPDDETLIAFSKLCKIDLDKLITAREGVPDAPAPPPVVYQPPLPPPPPEPVDLEALLAATRPAPRTPTLVSRPRPEPVIAIEPEADPEPDGLGHFTEELFALAPPPIDREKRKEWYRLAAKLYRLSEG